MAFIMKSIGLNSPTYNMLVLGSQTYKVGKIVPAITYHRNDKNITVHNETITDISETYNIVKIGKTIIDIPTIIE